MNPDWWHAVITDPEYAEHHVSKVPFEWFDVIADHELETFRLA